MADHRTPLDTSPRPTSGGRARLGMRDLLTEHSPQLAASRARRDALGGSVVDAPTHAIALVSGGAR